jgi:hypothetical protein
MMYQTGWTQCGDLTALTAAIGPRRLGQRPRERRRESQSKFGRSPAGSVVATPCADARTARALPGFVRDVAGVEAVPALSTGRFAPVAQA